MDIKNKKKSNKSKIVFKTPCSVLSKLAEQAKIHILYVIQKVLYMIKVLFGKKVKFSKSRDLLPL